jgi:hypothetical protein
LYYEAGDRTRFAYGIFLLNKDVEQLLAAHGLSSSGPNQLMANIYKLVTVAASALPQPPATASAAAQQRGQGGGGGGGGGVGNAKAAGAVGGSAGANGRISSSSSSSVGGQVVGRAGQQQHGGALQKAGAGVRMGVGGGIGVVVDGQSLSSSALGGASHVNKEDPEGPAVWEWYDLLPLPPQT